MKISRADIFVSSKTNDDSWFEEFLRIVKNQQEVFDAITGNKKKAVEEVVNQYREAVGLDLIKTASLVETIAPMKLKKLKNLDDILKEFKPEELIVEQKYDGWKTQVIKSNGKTKLFSRRGDEFSENLPDLVEELNKQLKDGDFILGEITYVENGKQNISDLQTIVSSTKEKSQDFQKNSKGKIILQAYDLLWSDGKDLTQEPYEIRYKKLTSKLKENDGIKIPKNYTWGEKQKAIEEALKSGGEGIVIKTKNSTYNWSKKGENEKTGEWYKFKPGNKAKEEDVIVKEYTKGKNKLIFPAYQYQDNELVEVSKISGLPKEDEQKVKNLIDKGKMVVLEVGFQEKYEDTGKLRHPGYKRMRPDLDPKSVKIDKKISNRK